MSDLRDLLTRTLATEGALVEPVEPNGLEILSPPHVQRALSLPEWCRVGFGPDLPEGALPITFESDWAERLERLLGDRGRFAGVVLQERPYPASHDDMERIVRRDLALQNATLRVIQAEETRASYLLTVFRVTASSDEKREDLVHICLNESNGAFADDLARTLLAYLRSRNIPEEQWMEDDPAAGMQRLRQIGKAAEGLLKRRIESQLSPFLAGMERRMARDLERLHTYHGDLQQEAWKRLAERSRKGGGEDEAGVYAMRLETIRRDYHAKVADLKRKYAMDIEVRFLQALRAAMPVRRVEIAVLRRKESRQVHLDWNPIAKRLDRLLCESCRDLPSVYLVCDERLHLVCPACLSACPSCGRESCRACNPVRCPKCAHSWHPGQDS
jgi:hypothetical protein